MPALARITSRSHDQIRPELLTHCLDMGYGTHGLLIDYITFSMPGPSFGAGKRGPGILFESKVMTGPPRLQQLVQFIEKRLRVLDHLLPVFLFVFDLIGTTSTFLEFLHELLALFSITVLEAVCEHPCPVVAVISSDWPSMICFLHPKHRHAPAKSGDWFSFSQLILKC